MSSGFGSFRPAHFAELLKWQAGRRPDQVVFRFLPDGETEVETYTFQALLDRASAFADQLRTSGIAPGSRIVIIEPQPARFVDALYGTLLAGCIAVPAYPPDPNRLERTSPRLFSIVGNCRPAALVVPEFALDFVRQLVGPLEQFQTVQVMTVDVNRPPLAQAAVTPPREAFLQYTSGSTGDPRGVRVSHRNLLANLEMIHQMLYARDFQKRHVGCSWLPLYHDMGLIGGVFLPVYLGATSVLMPPMAFLQKPFRWLQAITRYQATASAAPDFGYQLAMRKVSSQQMETLNLSSWTMALNGAEPIRAPTLLAFTRKFEPVGFSPAAIKPVYGLAEATLFVSGRHEGFPRFLALSRSKLLENQVEILSNPQDEDATLCVECGGAPDGEKLVIAQIDSPHVVPELKIGEICIAGENVSEGYYGEAPGGEPFKELLYQDGQALPEPFLRTGDLGFLFEHGLYVTGRRKDLLVFSGSNHYPQDIEQSVENASAWVRKGCVIAFSVEREGAERLILVVEAERRYAGTSEQFQSLRKNTVDPFQPEDLPGPLVPDELFRAIRESVFRRHGLDAHSILLVRPGSIPKTSSGKVQRQFCKKQYLGKELEVLFEDSRQSLNS